MRSRHCPWSQDAAFFPGAGTGYQEWISLCWRNSASGGLTRPEDSISSADLVHQQTPISETRQKGGLHPTTMKDDFVRIMETITRVLRIAGGVVALVSASGARGAEPATMNMEGLIDEALANNPSLAAWRHRLAAAEARIPQAGALAALQTPPDDLAACVAEWQQRRDTLSDQLRAWPMAPAAGGWSQLLDVGALGYDSFTASRRLLEHGKIAAPPMRDWGVRNGDQFVRLVFSNEPVERLAEMGERCTQALS